MLNDIGGYSVDKAKFVHECEPGVFQLMKDEFEEAVANIVGPRGGKTYYCGGLKKGKVEGTYLYVFDVWGDAAQDIDGLVFQEWFPYLDRMDLKLPMAMTSDGLQAYYDYAQPIVSGKRNIQLNDSPIRQKRGNRDAGGYSVSIGSHKSDFRVHWTLRGNEDGYQEFQLDGMRVEDIKRSTNHWMRNPDGQEKRLTWRGFCQALLVSAQVELSDLDGLYDSDRAGILAGSMEAHGIIERKLASIEYDIERLPKDACFALLTALELKLFPQPPEAEELDA